MNIKTNKISAALIALGVISLASVASAQTTIYLTGSTAARAAIYTACTTPGEVFLAAGGVVPTGPTTLSSGSSFTGSGANNITYEGYVSTGGTNNAEVILNCDFTGSEAGIASTAGTTLTQSVNGGNYALPGVPATFLAAPGYTAVSGTSTRPDFSMADTSQAVSLTPDSGSTKLKDYGVVGIVPFTWMKGYEASATAAWNDVTNVTIPQLGVAIGGATPANFITGNPADTNLVVVVGRNEGSGTRVNNLLNLNYGVKTPVDQFAIDSTYPSGTPGVLTFGTGAGFTLTEVVNDGYDGGSSVQKALNVDGGTTSGNGSAGNYVILGYLGLSDANNALLSAKWPTGGTAGAPTFLPLDGVYESNGAVEQGNYSYWGHEHLLGQSSEYSSSNIYGYTSVALVNGILAAETSLGLGTVATGKDYIIPASLMQVTKSTDVGYPVPNN